MDEEERDREEAITSAAIDFQDSMQAIANKMLWEIILCIIRPTDDLRDRILNEIVSVAVKDIRHGINSHSQELDADQIDMLTSYTDEGIKKAIEDFMMFYKGNILTPGFLDSVIGNMRNNLSDPPSEEE